MIVLSSCIFGSMGRKYLAKEQEMKHAMVSLLTATLLAAPVAWAQSIEIVAVEETAAGVTIAIETDLATPFEVMAGIGLAGQADDDICICNDERFTVRSATQTLTIKPEMRGKKLPTGTYDAEVDFYPRWGAANAPATTKAVAKQVSASRQFELKGSGESASKAAARENNQLWVMQNTAMGDAFNLAKFEKRLGRSVATTVTNRNGIIVAHYFPASDITLFENTLKGELVTWKLGRHATL